MKGKRWELPQKFRTIYWQNFALTASIVMLTLALLGAVLRAQLRLRGG